MRWLKTSRLGKLNRPIKKEFLELQTTYSPESAFRTDTTLGNGRGYHWGIIFDENPIKFSDGTPGDEIYGTIALNHLIAADVTAKRKYPQQIGSFNLISYSDSVLTELNNTYRDKYKNTIIKSVNPNYKEMTDEEIKNFQITDEHVWKHFEKCGVLDLISDKSKDIAKKQLALSETSESQEVQQHKNTELKKPLKSRF